MTQSLKLIDAFINKGISFFIFTKLLLLLLPDLISIILPISLLISIVFTYNRLLNDNEIIIWRSIGTSDWRLVRPALSLAMILCGLLYTLNLYFLPLAFQHSKDLEFQIRNNVNINMIRAQEFTMLKNIMVYVDHHNPDGSMAGILINDARNPAKIFTITAEFGKMMNIDGGARLILINGSRQEKSSDNGAPSILSFDQYSVDLNTDDHKYTLRLRKAHERFLNDLWNSNDTKGNPELHRKFVAEANQRLLMPLTVIIFALIALSMILSGEYNRRNKVKRIVTIVGLCIIFEALILTLVNFSGRSYTAIISGYMLSFFIIIFILIYFHKRARVPTHARAALNN